MEEEEMRVNNMRKRKTKYKEDQKKMTATLQ